MEKSYIRVVGGAMDSADRVIAVDWSATLTVGLLQACASYDHNRRISGKYNRRLRDLSSLNRKQDDYLSWLKQRICALVAPGGRFRAQ
jgi:hypothetical protein